MSINENHDLFNLTGHETPEELEAMLDSIDGEELADEPVETPTATDPAPASDDTTPPVDSDSADSAPASDDVEQQPSASPTDEPPAIATKDGKHTIPYAVLEAERNQATQLKQQLEQERQQREALEQQARLLEVRNQQLEDLGVKPADLPENFEFSGEALDELKENYPELAPFIESLNAKIERAAQAVPQPAPQPNPHNDVFAALQANADLSTWQTEGGDRWKVALDIDDSLLADPAWRSKTHAERLDEVARRTKAAFGDVPPAQTQANAQQAKADAESQLPASPSELGVSNNEHQSSLLQRAAAMDTHELNDLFSEMSEEQIEALLMEADGF